MDATDKLELEVIKVGNGYFKNYCYLLNSGNNAVLIDPAWEYDKISSVIKTKQLFLKAVLLTHSHIDHVNLAGEFAVNYSIPVYMSKEEIEFYKFTCPGLQPFVNMQRIVAGKIMIFSVLTPGHTFGSACFLVDNYIFTGDTLFTEGCGDCRGNGASAEDMFNSISLLKNLVRSDCLVYPGHSFGEQPGKPISFIEKNNIYYQLNNIEHFVKFRMRKAIIFFHLNKQEGVAISSMTFMSPVYIILFTRNNACYRALVKVSSISHAEQQQDMELLSEAEQAIAVSLAPARKFEFIAGRILAKKLLYAHSGDDNFKASTIAIGVFGQPVLLSPQQGLDICISHKKNIIAVVLFDAGHPVGMDVEMVCAENSTAIISQLTPAEQQTILDSSSDPIYYQTCIWSAKESLSKVLRCGLTIPFSMLETKNVRYLGDKCYGGEFVHFFQYRFLAFFNKGYVISFVFPRKSEIEIDKKFLTDFQEIIRL